MKQDTHSISFYFPIRYKTDKKSATNLKNKLVKTSTTISL